MSSPLLKPGTVLESQLNAQITVKECISQSGTDEIYLISYRNKEKNVENFHLTWYNKATLGEELHSVCRRAEFALAAGCPSRMFQWPMDLVYEKQEQFGIVFAPTDQKLCALPEFIKNPESSYLNAEAALHLVEAYQALHRAGLCMPELSEQNVMLDKSSGQIYLEDWKAVRFRSETAASENDTAAVEPDEDGMKQLLFIILFHCRPEELLQEEWHQLCMDPVSEDELRAVVKDKPVLTDMWPLMQVEIRQCFLQSFYVYAKPRCATNRDWRHLPLSGWIQMLSYLRAVYAFIEAEELVSVGEPQGKTIDVQESDEELFWESCPEDELEW